MRIDVYPTAETIPDKALSGRFAIVIDALRATSTLIAAVDNGCREAVPVATVQEAMELYHKLGEEDVLLGGERSAVKIEGFHLSNSPLEYTRETIEDRVIIFTTTNGTRAIRAAKDAAIVALGAFNNLLAVTGSAIESGLDIAVVCAGTQGRYAMEDTLAAGGIVREILKRCRDVQLDDLAQNACLLFDVFSSDLHGALEHSRHYRLLRSVGFMQDLEYCLKMNTCACVPVFSNGAVRAMSA